MSNVWFTSDLHIGHRLVAATRITKPNGDPIWHNGEPLPEWFGDMEVARHDEILAERWDSTVGEDDTVWVLGDICGGSDGGLTKALAWIQERPGIKRLIHGNHDPINGMHRDAYKYPARFATAFETTHAYIRRRVPLVGEGHQDILLTHFPYVDRFTGIGRTDRFNTYRLQNQGVPVVHGHTHSKQKLSHAPCTHECSEGHTYGAGCELGQPVPQLHVGVDDWDGAPVPLSWIVSEVQAWVGTIAPPVREIASQPDSDMGGMWLGMA